MALRTYPASIPSDVWSIVADLFAGNVPDKAYAIHCAEDTVAFALGKAFPDGKQPTTKPEPAIVDGSASKPITRDDCEAFCREMATKGKGLPTDFNWLGLALQILTLILDNLKSQ